MKTIPPYPLSFNNSGSEDSPEKKPPLNYNQTLADLKQVTKRKSVPGRPPNQNGEFIFDIVASHLPVF